MPVQYASQIYKDTSPEFIYLTSDQQLAEAFAAKYGAPQLGQAGGDLYRVNPVGESREDPDYAYIPGLSIACEKAVIQEVCARGVIMTTESARYAMSFMLWNDDSKMYDEDGFILPNEAMRRAGVTAGDLRSLGPDATFEMANARAQQLARRRQQSPWG